MSLRNVGIVYRKELTEALRDRRTLVSSILIPLFLFPILTVVVGYAFVEIADEAKREPSKIMVLGGNDSSDVMEQLKHCARSPHRAQLPRLRRSHFEQKDPRRRRPTPQFSGSRRTRRTPRREDLYFLR